MVHSFDGLADPPAKMKLTFQIQKNRQNGQLITFVADDKHPDICPVRAAYRIFLQAKRLGQSDNQLMGVFVNHQGITKYLTASKIAEVLQSFAQICHPDLTRDEIMQFTLHSIRVWAVVLLDEARMNADFIKSRLVGWVTRTDHIYETPRYSKPSTFLLSKNHRTTSSNSLARTARHYRTSSQVMILWALIDVLRDLIFPYQSFQMEGGGIPIAKKEGGIPILQNDCPNITFFKSLWKIHFIFAHLTQTLTETYAQTLAQTFSCMPATHSGVGVPKTIVH